MKRKYILTFAVLVALGGCTAVSNQAMKSESKDTVLAVINEFSKDSQAGIFNPFDIADISGKTPGLTRQEEYPAFQKWWCTRDSINKIDELINKVSDYCISKNGIFKNNWCTVNSEPLFMAKIGSGKIVDPDMWCTGTGNIGVLAVTGENSKNKYAWNSWASSKQGYLTENEQKTIAKSNFTLQVDAHKKQLEKFNKEQTEKSRNKINILNASRGAKICKEQNGYIYVGFKEDQAGDKIKILVSSSHIKGHERLITHNFSQSYIWDHPEYWYICE